jgi:hypothetical protein
MKFKNYYILKAFRIDFYIHIKFYETLIWILYFNEFLIGLTDVFLN